MYALYAFIAVMSLLILWFGIAAVSAFVFWLLCLIFGRNPAPATVPNKAVWG